MLSRRPSLPGGLRLIPAFNRLPLRHNDRFSAILSIFVDSYLHASK